MKFKDFTQGKWHQSHREIPNDEDGMYATQIYTEDVEITVLKTLTIEMPKGFMNTNISICNHFIADTNDSSNWDTIKFPLPKGKWSIHNIKGKMVTLGRTD